jgi:toxin ParE1/3/4
MKYSLIFSDEAQHDIIESIRWYNEQKENLGFELYDRLTNKLSLLSDNPLHYSIRFENIRASKVSHYPYLIYFKINDKNSSLIILGVLHTSRDPKTISKRK